MPYRRCPRQRKRRKEIVHPIVLASERHHAETLARKADIHRMIIYKATVGGRETVLEPEQRAQVAVQWLTATHPPIGTIDQPLASTPGCATRRLMQIGDAGIDLAVQRHSGHAIGIVRCRVGNCRMQSHSPQGKRCHCSGTTGQYTKNPPSRATYSHRSR